ncbi:MAG: hypothetical protein IJW29_04460 [Clostridia bacterium]|nr:hypothetical protein [Clostridia bacterium]
MIAVLGVALTVILRQWKSDLLPLVRVGFILLFATAFLLAAEPLFSFVRRLCAENAVGEYVEILFKALGIALVSEICASICRESGEGGIASGVELVGKLEILLLCVPMMENILGLAKSLLEMGG